MQEPVSTPFEPARGIAWLFLDLNSFFASCEQQDRPPLRGKPIAIVPMEADGTCAIAASAEAKRKGIRTGTKIYDARRLCPDVICVLARHNRYVDYHHRILAEIVRHTPIHSVCSIDELSSHLLPSKRAEAEARALANRIKEGLRTHIGPCITASIGLAPNAFLAKVATNLQKPDGLVVLTGETMRERLFALRLTDLPGINLNMEMRLWRAGITTIEAFWNLTPRQARAVWGSVEGERFWYNLHGYPVPDRPTHRSMVGHSRMLDPDHRDPMNARAIARRLIVKAASRLRRLAYYAGCVDLGVRGVRGERWHGHISVPATQDSFVFIGALAHLWDRMVHETNASIRRFKKVSVILHGLQTFGTITPDLFTPATPAAHEAAARRGALIKTLDTLNQRMGADTVGFGLTPRTQAGFVGTKIAFNRIPDAAEFWE